MSFSTSFSSRSTILKTYQSKRKELFKTMAQRQKTASSLRKKDAHEKIRLGGLIVKAELHHEYKTLLFGILNEAKQRLTSEGYTLKDHYLKFGKEACDQLELQKKTSNDN